MLLPHTEDAVTFCQDCGKTKLALLVNVVQESHLFESISDFRVGKVFERVQILPDGSLDKEGRLRNVGDLLS